MLNRIGISEVLDNNWIFVHTHDGVQAAIRGMNALEGGEAGLGEKVQLPEKELNVK